MHILYYLHIPGDSIRDLFIPKRSQRIARYISLTVILFEDLELLRVRKFSDTKKQIKQMRGCSMLQLCVERFPLYHLAYP